MNVLSELLAGVLSVSFFILCFGHSQARDRDIFHVIRIKIYQ